LRYSGLSLRVKPVIVGLSIGLALWVTLSTVVSTKSAVQISDLRADIQKRHQENERLTREINDLKAKLRALTERADVKEKLIREDTGFVRSDELLFQFQQPAAHPASKP
jgi:cell division protein FtsB